MSHFRGNTLNCNKIRLLEPISFLLALNCLKALGNLFSISCFEAALNPEAGGGGADLYLEAAKVLLSTVGNHVAWCNFNSKTRYSHK